MEGSTVIVHVYVNLIMSGIVHSKYSVLHSQCKLVHGSTVIVCKLNNVRYCVHVHVYELVKREAEDEWDWNPTIPPALVYTEMYY